MAATKGETKVVKIKDSVGASGGAGYNPTNPKAPKGISVGVASSGGGGRFVPPEEQAQNNEIHNQTYTRNRSINEQNRILSEENARRAEQNKEEEYSTRTGNYVEGGYVVQETTGKYEDLKRLQEQQPGSILVQSESGEYKVLRSNELSFGGGGLNVLNQNIEREGGQPYSKTSQKNAQGGTDYFAKLNDAVGGKSTPGGSIYGPEQKSSGTNYQVFLNEEISTGKKYQKTRPMFAREQAEQISKGGAEPHFIGPQGTAAREQVKLSLEQQNTKQPEVFPITYTDKSGKELVTITGKGPGTEFNIYEKSKEVNIPVGEKAPEANKIFPFPVEATNKKPLKDIITRQEESSPLAPLLPYRELIQRTATNIGVDIITQPSPLLMEEGYRSPASKIKQDIIQGYRKETQVDLLMEPKRWNEINPLSKEFLVPASVYVATGLIGAKPKLPKLKGGVVPTERAPEIATNKEYVPRIKKDIFKEDDILLDYSQTKIPLGRAAVKTQPPVYGKQPTPPTPVKPDQFFKPERPNKNIFERDTASTFKETQINLGKGTIENKKPSGKYNIFKPIPKPPEESKPSKEGLVLLQKSLTAQQAVQKSEKQLQLEKTKKLKVTGEFKSQQIALGTSSNTLQIRQGKVLNNTIQKPRTSSKSDNLFSNPIKFSYGTKSPQTTKQKTSQETILTISQTQKPKQKERQRFASFGRSIFPNSSRTKLITKQPLIPRQIQKLEEVPPEPKKLILPIFFPTKSPRKTKSQAEKLGSTKDFLGNVPLNSIIGVYKRKELTYGDRQISNLLGYEKRGNRPKKRTRSKTESFTGFSLSKKSKGLLF